LKEEALDRLCGELSLEEGVNIMNGKSETGGKELMSGNISL